MKIKGTSVAPTLSVVQMWISTLLFFSISPSLCLPPPVRTVQFSISVVQWSIAVKAMLRAVNEILSTGWLRHQPSHAFDDIPTPEFNPVLVIVISSHIL